MYKNEEICKCDKLINSFLLRAKKFIEYACFQYGKYQYAISEKIDASFVSDFQYFVFTKSTKSLESIRALLDIGHTEDVFILVRSMFEGYLASRFIDENFQDSLVNDFIFIPQLISHRKVIYNNRKAKIRGTNEIIAFLQRNPSDMILGKDKNYFYDLYDYLCDYAHCNFSILGYYLDEEGRYTCDNVVNEYLVRILVLFVYTKLFESIVTVEGEDFITEEEKKKCYKLVKDSTEFLCEELGCFSNYTCEDVNDELNKHMKGMFKEMKKSLKEEVGSVKKIS